MKDNKLKMAANVNFALGFLTAVLFWVMIVKNYLGYLSYEEEISHTDMSQVCAACAARERFYMLDMGIERPLIIFAVFTALVILSRVVYSSGKLRSILYKLILLIGCIFTIWSMSEYTMAMKHWSLSLILVVIDIMSGLFIITGVRNIFRMRKKEVRQ